MNTFFKKITTLLFITLFIKGIVWALLVPLWHFPDEQAHFGHVAFIAEGGDLKRHGKYPDLTEEIYVSEDILGTKRDIKGNNRFTFHPQYRLDYSENLTGPEEEKIKTLPLETRKNLVYKESAYYPHFFYQLSSLVYKLFYKANLFIRVFALRLFWLSAYFLMIWFVFKSAQLIFPQNQLAVAIITLLTSFHPMLSFVSAGVTSDNLHNLLFTAVVYFGLKIIAQPKWYDFLGLTLTLGLGMINKQQFFIAFLIITPSLLFALFKQPKRNLKYFLFLPLAFLIAYLLAPNRITNLFSLIAQGKIPYLKLKPSVRQIKSNYKLLEHFIWTLEHTVKEVLPWYWGVFNWLGVALPRWINRVLMRLLALAGLGLIIKLVNIIKQKKLTRQDLLLGFIIWTAIAYFVALMVWDWTFTRNNGFSFGFQGRYYFPVIVSHMILLFIGIRELASLFGKRLTRYFLLILSLWFIFLNLAALYTVTNSYYNTTSLKTFIIQASQYKPFFAKGWWLITALILYLISCFVLVYNLTKMIFKSKLKP